MFKLNSRFLTQNLTGVQRYGYELFKQINFDCNDVEYLIPNDDINKSYEIGENINIKKIGKFKSHAWEQLDLPKYLKKSGSPLLLNLCNTAPLFYENQIVTIHDIAFLKGNWHSRNFKLYYKFLIPKIIKNSRHIITVSEFSKQEIVSSYGVDSGKISVIYNAPFTIKNDSEIAILDLKTPYILSVGSIDPRKNLKRLVKAFVRLNEPDLKLYLTGAYNSNFKNDAELDNLIIANTNQIIFLGYRTDTELIHLYKNALCFIYPSLYEGFGLPPIEAMSNNCPVITSNLSSLPEVCGDAPLYCNPFSVADILEQLKEMVQNRKTRESCILKGHENVKKFSWNLSGQALIRVINSYN